MKKILFRAVGIDPVTIGLEDKCDEVYASLFGIGVPGTTFIRKLVIGDLAIGENANSSSK